tara:strand:- start:1118 stop:2701 length:1584 start_codon:yes stop_codon:yes gene_type:complete
MIDKALNKIAETSSAWPFQEARRLLERFSKNPPKDGVVLFETGYGPSGLPHIGTFGEVARTSMVRNAFKNISDLPTKLYAFSDDMDALRQVPDNLPNRRMLEENLGKPLTMIPDPFDTHESFGHNMNARLCSFLDRFDFDYEFKSASEIYKSGEFDKALSDIVENYDKIINIILPTLGEERKATYSPLLPICPKSGRVLQVHISKYNSKKGKISYIDETTGEEVEVPITGGHCKLQWKADWAMRWHALGVDYEMSGKDLIPSVELSGKICRVLGSSPPIGFSYELFLDENGEKISKSRGNGLTIDEWLRYGSSESLSLFMFNSPKRAKRLYFDTIPRHVDDYIKHLEKYIDQDESKRLENPAWHINTGNPPRPEKGISYNILLNLASACNTDDPEILWGFISRYVPDASAEKLPALDHLVNCAVNFYNDFVKPNKKYLDVNKNDYAALSDLQAALGQLPRESNAETIQTIVYEIGKKHNYTSLKIWFSTLYQILFGQKQGPRMGSFIALYGIKETIELIEDSLKRTK